MKKAKTKLNIPMLITGIFLAVLIFSCNTAPNTKEQYLNDYSSFIKDIKENKAKYSEEEWAKKDEEFSKYSSELYSEFEGEMGLLEKGKIAKYAINYATARGTSAFNEAIKGDDINNAFKDIKNIFNDDVKSDFDQAFEDLKQVWDNDLKGELEDKLDEVKEILEDEKLREDIKSKIEDIKEIANDEELKGKVEDVFKELEEVFKEIEEKIEE